MSSGSGTNDTDSLIEKETSFITDTKQCERSISFQSNLILKMNILKDIFDKKLAENEGKIRFWEDYLKNLKTLDFSLFSDKLSVPILVPIGSRIFFRGALKHTNELTVSLGADYFAKCSLQQAETLRLHRIKDAESKLEIFKKEKEYLVSQINFSQENVFGDNGQDIIEVHTDEEDKAWRKKHRENVRKYKQSKDKSEECPEIEISDEALWNRLEELELQEELENEFLNNDKYNHENIEETYLSKNLHHKQSEEDLNIKQNSVDNYSVEETKQESIYVTSEHRQNSQLNVLQQVLIKQNELEKKLTDLKNRDRATSKTEGDLLSRLDEIEQLEELEDEMDRLDDILHEDNDNNEVEENENNKEMKRSVTFADEDESETLELTFTHSKMEPCKEPYNPEKGIMKPSDIYAAYSHMFTETTSILKKTKYECSKTEPKVCQNHDPKSELSSNNVQNEHKTIIVKDILEKGVHRESTLETNETRPISIFKKRRQQKS